MYLIIAPCLKWTILIWLAYIFYTLYILEHLTHVNNIVPARLMLGTTSHAAYFHSSACTIQIEVGIVTVRLVRAWKPPISNFKSQFRRGCIHCLCCQCVHCRLNGWYYIWEISIIDRLAFASYFLQGCLHFLFAIQNRMFELLGLLDTKKNNTVKQIGTRRWSSYALIFGGGTVEGVITSLTPRLWRSSIVSTQYINPYKQQMHKNNAPVIIINWYMWNKMGELSVEADEWFACGMVVTEESFWKSESFIFLSLWICGGQAQWWCIW